MSAAVVRFILGLVYAAAFIVTVAAFMATANESAAEPAELWFESPEIEARARPAVAQIEYEWSSGLPGWKIEFLAGNSDVAGYTWSRENRIEVFVRPGSDTDNLARVLAHELGHAVDVSRNDGDERRRWLEARDAPEAPWWPGDGSADFSTGAGDFAEVFTVWQVGTEDFRSEIGPLPDDDVLALLVELTES